MREVFLEMKIEIAKPMPARKGVTASITSVMSQPRVKAAQAREREAAGGHRGRSGQTGGGGRVESRAEKQRAEELRQSRGSARGSESNLCC